MKAPIPTAGPYYVAEYVPGRQVVLERNRFYRGSRPHRVDRIDVDLTGDAATVLERVERGELDYGWLPTSDFATRAAEFQRKYGLNRARFFAVPASFLRFFALNASRPLFRNNVELRQAVNFAVDPPGAPAGARAARRLSHGPVPATRPARLQRRADLSTSGPQAGDCEKAGQRQPPGPEGGPLRARHPSRRLAGSDREGEPREDRLAGDDKEASCHAVLRQAVDTGGAVRHRMGRVDCRPSRPVAPERHLCRAEHPRSNHGRFDSPKYNALLDQASRLQGARRYQKYGRLDVDLARNAAPAIAYAYDNALTFVSARTGCIVLNPYLDLAAVCLNRFGLRRVRSPRRARPRRPLRARRRGPHRPPEAAAGRRSEPRCGRDRGR